ALGWAEDYKGLGREFMPELEEGNLWIRCTAPLNQTLERNVDIARQARAIMAGYPEVEAVVTQSGRPDDGTDTCGFYNTEYFGPWRPKKDWPPLVEQPGGQRGTPPPPPPPPGGRGGGVRGRARTKEELVTAMNAELERKVPGVVWNFSQNIRDNVMEAL